MIAITIEEDELNELSENAEKMLRYGGKLMTCIDRMKEHKDGEHFGNRRGGMYGRRDDDWRDEEEHMTYRRGRDGRYM